MMLLTCLWQQQIMSTKGQSILMKKIMKSSRIVDTGCAPYLARETGREVHGDDKASTKNKLGKYFSVKASSSSGISRSVTAKEIGKKS